MSVIQRVSAGEYEVPRTLRDGKWSDYAGTVTRTLTVTATRGFIPDEDGACEMVDTDIETDVILNPTPAAVVSALRNLGLTFGAYGDGVSASHPDGSTIVDYGTGEREELFARIEGFTPMQTEIIGRYVDDYRRESSVMFL
jgi:hypothetical protein